MTILEENHQGFLIVEHDPMLYEDAGSMEEYIAQDLKQASREATVLIYSPGDRVPTGRRWWSWLTWVFCIYGEQALAKGLAKAEAKMPGAQDTLEVYSSGGHGGCGMRSSRGLRQISRSSSCRRPRRYWRR